MCIRDRPLADDIDSNLNIDAGAKRVELCRRVKRRLAGRQVNNGHQICGKILHGNMKDRKVAVIQWPLAIDQLYANPETTLLNVAVIDDRLPLAREFVVTAPMNRLSDAHQDSTLRIQNLVGRQRFDRFQRTTEIVQR